MEVTSLKSRMQVFILPLLILLSAGVYWNTLANDFVAGDRQFILRNEHIGDLDTVLSSLTSDYWGKLGGESFIYYRPLVILTHFIDYKIYGLNTAGHHLTNIFFHCMVTLTVYFLFLTVLSGKQWPAFSGAALFALHPIHTHSVSYVMGRTDILATAFYLWGLILLLKINRDDAGYFRILSLLGACLCYFFSLLCKEMAITLPLVFVVYQCCVDKHKISWRDKDFLITLLFLAGTLCLYLILRVSAVGMTSQQSVPHFLFSLHHKIGLVFHTLGFYLQKLLFPTKLCYYSNIVVPGSWQETVASPLFLTCMLWLITCAGSLKYRPPLSFALVWIGITLLPVLNIIMLPALAKENYLYLPSIGFCLIFAILLDKGIRFVSAGKNSFTALAVSGTIVIGLLYAAGTISRNLDYRTPLSFLESTINNMPPVAVSLREDPRFFEPVKNFFTTYKNLGIIYQECNKPEQAINSFRSAMKYTPSYFSNHYAASVKVLLAVTLDQTGRSEEALVMLKEARPFADNPAAVDNRLGMVSSKMGNNQDAEVYFKQAIMKNSRYAAAHYNLGIMYLTTRERRKGMEELRTAVRLNPSYADTLAYYRAISCRDEQH